MYIPAAFQETDPAKLFALIAQHSFGLLVSHHEGEPFATHLPMLADRAPGAGPHGQIVGHMARANPHWQHAQGQAVLAVFSGPHAYISPTWYDAVNVVPTWNYVAIHVYGQFHAIHDDQATLQIVRDMVRVYESPMPRSWSLDAQGEFNARLVKNIVGFRIEISRIEGKLKLSQNQPKERSEKVVRALEQSPDLEAKAIAALMKANL